MSEITVNDAERIRRSMGVSVYEFSVRLGYSPTAYKYAVKKKSISRWMAREISIRYGKLLAEVRG